MSDVLLGDLVADIHDEGLNCGSDPLGRSVLVASDGEACGHDHHTHHQQKKEQMLARENHRKPKRVILGLVGDVVHQHLGRPAVALLASFGCLACRARVSRPLALLGVSAARRCRFI